MNSEMNIYQKISVLQNKIRVNKDSINEFANFKYRTIQDILSELKPILSELDLIVNFGNCKIKEDTITMDMRIIDINSPENTFTETSEILIDRTKSKMDLSQKCLSAKTFLKKAMLEDILLLSEDADPDGYDNRKPDEENEDGKIRTTVKNILYFASGKDKIKMIDLLDEYTMFEGKDGRIVNGVRDVEELSGKRLRVTYGKIRKKYPEIYETVSEKLNQKKVA